MMNETFSWFTRTRLQFSFADFIISVTVHMQMSYHFQIEDDIDIRYY